MYADVKGALNQLDKIWKAFTVKGYQLSKQSVKRILEYAVAKGYEHTGQIRDSEIDHLLNKGTTIEQWERYYEDLKRHEERCEREKPLLPEHNTDENMMAYSRAESAWRMMRSCDAPNKPGYYRANND